jgi:hypothetical protein
MKISLKLQMFALFAAAACIVCAQRVLAQDSHHRQVRVAAQPTPDGRNGRPETAPPPNLYALQATFTQVNPTEGPNADGSDLWPCFGNSASPNPNCPTIGDPSIPFRTGGIVVGYPQYVWKLANNQGYGYGDGNGNGNGCDALINGTTGPAGAQYRPCGQIATWYEDDTNDSTDDLLQRIVVRQGARVIYDSGTVDYGPAGPTVAYPVEVILSNDANFGFWPGADESAGPNNGNCSPDNGYPLTSPKNPGKLYVVRAGRTCQQPVPGLATFTTSTVLATPSYAEVTGAPCTSKGVVSPCYTVEWIKRYEIRQDFNIFLE